MGKQWKQCQTLFLGVQKSLQMVTAAMKLKRSLLLGRKAMTNLDSILESRDITLRTKVGLVKAVVFPVVSYKEINLTDPSSWEIDGETVETVSDFIFLGSKITTDGDAAMKLKDAYSLEGKL